ncbi:MAG: GGDEF domain-containing protein [Eubacteriales bacterium]
MKRKLITHKSSDLLWQTTALLFFWIFLFTLIVGFLDYLALCYYLPVFPFLSWGSMEPRQQIMIVCIVISMLVLSFCLTMIISSIYKKIIYYPLKTLLSEVERASKYEGLADHAELYLRGGKMNIFDLSNPRQLWTDRVKDYIDSVTKERYFDDTTGCFNRKYFSQAITDVLKTQMMCSITHRSGFPRTASNQYCMYLIDIDHFKLINDEFGHQYGDEVLGQVGTTLRSVVGSAGIVIRSGGEEFLVIVYINYPMNFSQLAEKLRVEFSETVYVINPKTQEIRPVTCSIGFVPFPVFQDDLTALSVEQHVNLSDQAMYLAKSEGRNTWRGIEANITPGSQSEFDKAAVSLEYGTKAGYFKVCRPTVIPADYI